MVSSIINGLRRAGFVLLLGGLVGLMLQASSSGHLSIQTWSPVDIGNSVLAGILYVAVTDGIVQLTRLLGELFFPLRSDRDVLYRALLPAGSTLLVFVGLTAVFKSAFGAAFSLPWPVLLRLGVLAALAVGSVSGLLALRAYYRQDRRDHAEGWEARMRRLRTRVLPSILFESLATTHQLLDEDPSEAKPILDRLHDLLQYRQQAAAADTVPLAEEIDAALSYVELAQVQHDDDLEIGFDVPDPLLSVPVPRLCLLPLLENAIEHGANALDEPCTITVTGRYDGNELCLAVLDTGPGFDTTDPDTILRRGSGIADLYARLREHYGSATDLSLLPQGVLWCAPLATDTDVQETDEDMSSMPSPPPQ